MRSMFGTDAEAPSEEAPAAHGADEGTDRAGLATAGTAVFGDVGSEEAAGANDGRDVAPRDAVSHPAHYTSGDVECIDGIRAALGDEGFESYCAGNVIKYVWRYRHKGGLADVRKAIEYLCWLAEDLEHDERAEAEREFEAVHGSKRAAECDSDSASILGRGEAAK